MTVREARNKLVLVGGKGRLQGKEDLQEPHTVGQKHDYRRSVPRAAVPADVEVVMVSQWPFGKQTM